MKQLVFGLVFWAVAWPAAAQTVRPLVDGTANGVISAAGSSCAPETRCFAIDVKDVPSWTISILKGTSVTVVWEVQIVDGGTWYAYPGGDDAGGAATATADGIYLFTGTGYSAFRARASALSGNTTIIARRGGAGVKSAASLTSGGDATAAKQDTQITAEQAIQASADAIDTSTGASNTTLTNMYTVMTTSGTGLSVVSGGGANDDDEHAVKATAGTLYSITATNTAATVAYLRCSNATAGNTTPGTTTGVIDLAIPGAATGAGLAVQFPVGFAFSTALTCWISSDVAFSGITDVAANVVKILYTFK